MNVLCLSPHTDDAELGAGGTIARMIQDGHRVKVVAFSLCAAEAQNGHVELAPESEFYNSMAVLGVSDFTMLGYSVRTLPMFRQDILEQLLNLRDAFLPDMVLMPSLQDCHQDHVTVAKEGLRAFRGCTMLGYEMPKNQNQRFVGACFLPLKPGHVCVKQDAVRQYESQRFRRLDDGLVQSLAIVRGRQAGCEFAECFEVIRWIYSW